MNAYHNRKGSVSDRTVEEETLGVGVWVVVTNIKSIPQRVTSAYAGREVVTIIPQAEISQVQKDTPPHANSSKVETLKGGDYVRLWINKGGNHYLVHFPA